MERTYSRQQEVVASSSAGAALFSVVAAPAETLAAYDKALRMTMSGEVCADSSAALGISQLVAIGLVRHQAGNSRYSNIGILRIS